MKDIDFDELDKAVNSLMSSVTNKPAEQQSEPSTPQSVAQTPSAVDNAASTITPTPSQNVQPTSEVQVAQQSTPARDTPQAVRKSSGRFMDVVHPSSDMRSASPIKAPARSSGITPPVRPLATVSPPKQPPQPPQVSPKPDEPQPTASAVDGASKELSFPDPLDMMPKAAASKEGTRENTTKEEPAPAVSDAELTEKLSQTSKVVTDESSEPLESLFLPNVKVEKRPLNIASSNDATPGEDKIDDEPKMEKDDAEKKDVASLVTPDPMLAELGEDVLAIESDSSSTVAKKEAGNEEAVSPTEPQATDMPNIAAGSMTSSIPRQYSVKPSSDSKHHEALYDTAAQSGAPLAHPAKRKSGWMVVLWTVLLIVIGVGGALALYFLKVF